MRPGCRLRSTPRSARVLPNRLWIPAACTAGAACGSAASASPAADVSPASGPSEIPFVGGPRT